MAVSKPKKAPPKFSTAALVEKAKATGFKPIKPNRVHKTEFRTGRTLSKAEYKEAKVKAEHDADFANQHAALEHIREQKEKSVNKPKGGSKRDKKEEAKAALVQKLAQQEGVEDPEALAAWIGRRVGGLK